MDIQANLRASFRDVKMEIISIKNQILQIAESQKELAHMVAKLQKSKSSGKGKAVKKKVVKKVAKKKVVRKRKK